MCSDSTYLVADFNSIQKRVDELKHRSDDVKSRLALPLKSLWNPERKLRAVSESVDFRGLRQSFPQFEEVIEYYENSILSLARMNLSFEVPPILLQGDPGLGKTYFASEFAKCINLPFFEISLATTSSSFGLSGGNIQWAEGSTGFIANTLAKSDKVSREARYNPLNVFYSLLETHSAKRFRDEALEVELDASKIVWIATGNYIQLIPEPIQSRMRIFNIKQPSLDHMPSVIKSIYNHLVQNKVYGKLLDHFLNENVIDYLVFESPRTIKLAIEESAFKAIRHQRSTIYPSDLPVFKKEGKYHVGFI